MLWNSQLQRFVIVLDISLWFIYFLNAIIYSKNFETWMLQYEIVLVSLNKVYDTNHKYL